MNFTIDFGKVTDWLTALGTVGTALTALYLANRDNAVRLQAFATVGLVLGGPNPPSSVKAAPRYVWINVTNAGRRAAYVTNIGWRSGVLGQRLTRYGHRHYVQSYLRGSGPQLPLKLIKTLVVSATKTGPTSSVGTAQMPA